MSMIGRLFGRGKSKENEDLVRAARLGEVSQVRTLLEKGADINYQTTEDEDGWTPLIGASYRGHLEVVQLLLAKGAEVNKEIKGDGQDTDGWTALYSATWGNHGEVVQALITKGANVNHQIRGQKKSGGTALLAAAGWGYEEIVQFLLAGAANVDIQDKSGTTALMLASFQGRKGTVEALLAKGADANLRDKDGKDAIGQAAVGRAHNYEITRLLENARGASSGGYDLLGLSESDQGTFRLALQDDNTQRGVATVEHFLDQGLKANAVQGDGGPTLLMLAANNGCEDIARLLIDRGADVSATSERCQPPLSWAASGGCIEIVTLLLERGAEVNATDSHGQTALGCAKHSLSANQSDVVRSNLSDTWLNEHTIHLERIVELLVSRGGREA